MKYKSGAKCDISKKPGISGQRIYALVFLFLGIGLFISSRLYSLQVTAHEMYTELADGQHTLFEKLVPNRGEIFLKGKDDLYKAAANQATKLVYIVPKEIDSPSVVADFLSSSLQIDREDILKRASKADDMYELIKHRLSDDEISKINNSGLKGIHLADETFRYYPSGELASNVLGFVGWRDNDFGGRYGIESFFNKELAGEEGKLSQKSDAGGKWISTGEKVFVPAKDGSSLVLTIDHIVQYETEKILKGAIEKFDAEGGSIIVMEPETGKILSMASYPTFDPNNYASVDDINAYNNTAVSSPYECGSVFKGITLAAGVDSGKINPDTTYVDTGAVKEAGYTIRNSDLKANGKQTMTNVLEKSLNTGAIFVEKLLGNKNFQDYVKRFGFGEKTGIELPGENDANINNLANLRSDIQFFTASFGQGITVTPIQLISAYNAIANGGVLMKPQIIEKSIDTSGNETIFEPKEVRRVISEKAALQTSMMLESVVVNGHGKRAGVPGYRIGGKTGTAQVASSQSKGYESGKNIGSFAGFGPLENPKFTILVKMINPKAVEWAESSAAPTFGELMKFLLEYYAVEPTQDYTQKQVEEFNATHTILQQFGNKEKTDSAETAAPVTTTDNKKAGDNKKDKKSKDGR